MSYATAALLSLAGSTITFWSLWRGEALRHDDEPLARRIGPLPLIGLFITFVAGAVGLADAASARLAVPILDYGALGLQWLGFGSLVAAFAWGPRFQGNETPGQKVTLWGGLGLALIGAAQLCGLVSGKVGVELQQLRDYAGLSSSILGWLAVALMVLGTASLAGLMRLNSWLREGEGSLLQRTNLAVRVSFSLLGLALVIVALLNVFAPTPAIFLSFLLLGFGMAATAFGSYLDRGDPAHSSAGRKWASVGLLGLACLVTAADQGAQVTLRAEGAALTEGTKPAPGVEQAKKLDQLQKEKTQTQQDLLQAVVGAPKPAPRVAHAGPTEVVDLRTGTTHLEAQPTSDGNTNASIIRLEKKLSELVDQMKAAQDPSTVKQPVRAATAPAATANMEMPTPPPPRGGG
jgi:hypothetical protein